MRKTVRLTVLVTFIAVALGLQGAAGALVSRFTTPERLGFKTGDDWEPSIAADRFGHVYALWTHYGSDPRCAACASPHMELQVSSDGGRTWSAPRPLWRSSVRQDDPQVVVDPADGKTVYASFMSGNKASMMVSKSTDFGKTWSTKRIEDLQRGTDKEILAVRGRHVYVAYNAVMKIYVSVSHDGGRTWSTHNMVPSTTAKLGWSLPGGGGVDSKGNAYFAWAGYKGSGKPSGPVTLFVTRSTNGGRSWTTSKVDVSQSPPPCICGWAYWGAQMTLALDNSDNVYVLYNANRRKGAPNRMFFARSGNGGRSWSGRTEVSEAPRGSNNLFPAIAGGRSDDVRIAWQDDRNGFDEGDDALNARWNTYYRSSTDGGRSWSPESRLSRYVPGYDYKFAKPKPGYLEPYGDYFEIDIDGEGRTHALWGEGPSYAGPGNVWYARDPR